MPLILNIDTATENAIVCLSENETILAFEENHDQKNHAAFVQPAIEKLFNTTNIKIQNIDSVAVTAGPGSYTGLRVGLASAKGLCYALRKPIILINTLDVMAKSIIREFKNQKSENIHALFCPMIDARRMEVFMALYDSQLQPLLQPSAIIIDEDSFAKELSEHSIIFAGNGSIKLKALICHKNAIFSSIQHNASDLSELSLKAYNKNQFSELAYCEPYYLKEFYNLAKN
jgi:tRNA threonylcarbamoyladenosine biosynthesis protein TsaB